MTDIHDDVRSYYRKAVTERAASPTTDERWGRQQYDGDTLAEGSSSAADLSMGCGNPYVMADLAAGETVLDLGSGGGKLCYIASQVVGAEGQVIGVDGGMSTLR